jgi:1,4-alpha-glucan branching enzyme
LLEDPLHAGVQKLVKDLNSVYDSDKALWQADNEPAGFEWLDVDNAGENILAFVRRASSTDPELICVSNFSAVPRPSYKLNFSHEGEYDVVINTAAKTYNGDDNLTVTGGVLDLPPLTTVWLSPRKTARKKSRKQK